MKRRILAAILATTVLALLLFGVPLGFAIARHEVDIATAKLEREATLAAGAVSSDYLVSNDPVELPTSKNIELTFYSKSLKRILGFGPTVPDRFVTVAASNRIASGEVGETLVAAVPVVSDETVIGVIRAERSLAATDRQVQRYLVALAGFGVAILALSALLGRFLADRIARSVREVRDEALRLGDGTRMSERPPTGIAELDDLSTALRSTGTRLASTLERERAFTENASHQLRTPLTGLRLIVDNELATPRSEPRLALVEALMQVDRLEATVDTLLGHARGTFSDRRPLNVEQLVQTAADRWRATLAEVSRPLRTSCAVTTEPRAHGVVLTQALDVLLENAMRHGAGLVAIEAREIASGVSISVTDEGPGIDGDPESIFLERTASNEGRRRIGLALARSLVEGEGGRLSLERAKPSARFTILLASDPPVPGQG